MNNQSNSEPAGTREGAAGRPLISCSAATFVFLQKFSTFGEFYEAVEALTGLIGEEADDASAQFAGTLERCRLCGLWSTMTDNDHVLIGGIWHVACPECLWHAYDRADLHVDHEMKNTRFIPQPGETTL